MSEKKQRPVCVHCKSEDVVLDANVCWNHETQDWILEDTYDNLYCRECEDTTGIEWVED